MNNKQDLGWVRFFYVTLKGYVTYLLPYFQVSDIFS